MNAIERIEAAIEHLIEIKGDGYAEHAKFSHHYMRSAYSGDALVLARTIDPQVTLLRSVRSDLNSGRILERQPEARLALALADSITEYAS